MKKQITLAAAALSLCAAPAFAQTSDADEIVVTARPIIEENATDRFGSLSTVVTDEQISDLNAIDLSSALRRSPGVTVSRFNPVGSFGGGEGGAVFVRGFGASRPGAEIKTYVDGAPFYMGVWNHPLLDLLPVNGLDRISVFKGPQPQVFGNNFAAIDVTTRRAAGEGVEGDLRLSAGSFSTIIEQFNASGRAQAFDWSFAQGYAVSDGHRDDADGELLNAMGSVGYQLNPNWSVRATLLYADNEVSDPGQDGLPATKTGDFNTRGTFGTLSLSHSHNGSEGRLLIYANNGEGAWLDQPVDGDTISTFDLYGVRWTESFSPWSGGTISVGADYDVISGEVNFNNFFRFDGPTLRLLMPHVAVAQDFDFGSGWTLTPSVGVRFYDHSVLDEETAPHAGLVLRSSNLSFRANYARGVNYPGLDAAVLSTLIPALGESWRDLSAELVDHYEIGLSADLSDSTRVDVAFFSDALENRYIFAFPPTVPAPAFVNLGAYDIQGAEISLQQRLSDEWSAFLGVTFLDASLNTIPYVPETGISFGLNGDVGQWRFRFDAQYQSEMLTLSQERAGGAINTQSVDAYTVLNARIAYALPRLGDDGEVFIAIENLGDADYEMRPGYSMPGASAQVGFNWSF